MTPTEAAARDRHLAFKAEIARRAALVPQKESRTHYIPNTPFGVKKVRPVKWPVPEAPIDREWWPTMWFGDLVSNRSFSTNLLTVAEIVDAVSTHFNVSKTDILSHRRTRHIVLPRQVCYYLAKKLTLKSLPEIGRRLGGRDHTSCLSGIRKIDGLRKTNSELEASLRVIASKLGGQLA